MKLTTKNKTYSIIRNKLDYPQGHMGFSYDVFKAGRLWKDNISKKMLDNLRKQHKF